MIHKQNKEMNRNIPPSDTNCKAMYTKLEILYHYEEEYIVVCPE